MTADEKLPADSSPAPLVWDRAAMLERMMGDEDLVHTIMEVALANLADQLQVLDGLLAAGDMPGVKRQAHTIKGAAANLSAEALRRLAAEMEQAAAAGDVNAASGGLEALRAALTCLIDELERG